MNETAILAYIITIWIVWFIVFLLLGILFVIFSLIKRIRKERWLLLLPLALITVLCLVPTFQGAIDINRGSFVTEQVEYYRADASNTRNSITASNSVQITLSDGTVTILRGAGNFPYGRYTGTVTYAKTSKIIIDFVPDNQ